MCGRCAEGGCGALKSRKKPTTTTKVEQSPAGPLHALRAEGTVADIFVFHKEEHLFLKNITLRHDFLQFLPLKSIPNEVSV